MIPVDLHLIQQLRACYKQIQPGGGNEANHLADIFDGWSSELTAQGTALLQGRDDKGGLQITIGHALEYKEQPRPSILVVPPTQSPGIMGIGFGLPAPGGDRTGDQMGVEYDMVLAVVITARTYLEATILQHFVLWSMLRACVRLESNRIRISQMPQLAQELTYIGETEGSPSAFQTAYSLGCSAVASYITDLGLLTYDGNFGDAPPVGGVGPADKVCAE